MIEETKCPLCDGPMKSRANKTTGQRFWGCADFPKCKGTRDTDGEARVVRDGVAELDDLMPSDRQRSRDKQRWRS